MDDKQFPIAKKSICDINYSRLAIGFQSQRPSTKVRTSKQGLQIQHDEQKALQLKALLKASQKRAKGAEKKQKPNLINRSKLFFILHIYRYELHARS